jgi:acyl-coenzyme A thioesterase PaaI-like protein
VTTPATDAMRAFDTATNAGAMSRSELAHLIGADTIETIAIGDGYLRSRLHIPEGARAGFEAVFSGTFACWVDWVGCWVVAAGKDPSRARDLLDRVRTQGLSVDIVGNTMSPTVILESRVDSSNERFAFVTVNITEEDGTPIATGRLRLAYARKQG